MILLFINAIMAAQQYPVVDLDDFEKRFEKLFMKTKGEGIFTKFGEWITKGVCDEHPGIILYDEEDRRSEIKFLQKGGLTPSEMFHAKLTFQKVKSSKESLDYVISFKGKPIVELNLNPENPGSLLEFKGFEKVYSSYVRPLYLIEDIPGCVEAPKRGCVFEDDGCWLVLDRKSGNTGTLYPNMTRVFT